MTAPLRFVTYLAPGLPLAYFQGVAGEVAHVLGCDAVLRSITDASAPLPGERDPFSSREADVGFLCAPGYFWLATRDPSPVELVAAAPVFTDPRALGRPVYFADVIVARASEARSFADLSGARWISNDPGSLSGHFCVHEKLASSARGVDFFRDVSFSGSHAASIAAVREGSADAAAIDSNVLALAASSDPSLRNAVRVLESWGPFPIQPIVVRAELPGERKREIAAAFRALAERGAARAALEAAGVVGFVETSDADYAAERARFERCQRMTADGALGSRLRWTG